MPQTLPKTKPNNKKDPWFGLFLNTDYMVLFVCFPGITLFSNVDVTALYEYFRALKRPPMEHFKALKCSNGGGFRTLNDPIVVFVGP